MRAGRNGEHEEVALDRGYAVIGWSRISDLSGVKTREELHRLCEEAYPNRTPSTMSNFVGQIWTFREKIKVGDLVVLPLKTHGAIAVGKVTGPYEFRADLPHGARHARPVEWIRTDIPRNSFGQDLLYSFGAYMTVCQVKRNDAEMRVKRILEGKPDSIVSGGTARAGEGDGDGGEVDFEQAALDQIRDYIGRKFKGHGMARLVESVLAANGYSTRLSPEGADEGVDIIAGKGALGFDSPRICVQVKSGDAPADVGVLRELEGVMKNFRADHGILVSWGGFKTSVYKEAAKLFFEVRLWDADEFVRNLFACYPSLSEEIRAELPLQRIWAKVRDEE